MRLLACIACALVIQCAFAYEVVNHSDMSESASRLSSLKEQTPTGKLFRLGLKTVALDDPRQYFPRASGTALTGEDAVSCWPIDPTTGRRNIPADFTRLTLIQLLRYGACYEDNVDNGLRVFGHFYNPQGGGAGLFVPIAGQQPSSPVWTLTGAGATTGVLGTGLNHFTYADARTSFFRALTSPTKAERDTNWGLTFQSLGHVVHHLQDMAQPQHVRADDHCDALECRISGRYKPSGYEKLMKTSQFVQVIRTLAATASTPILFGLPRDFWNSTGSDDLNAYTAGNEGIAAYTSTNFVSAGTDFRFSSAGSPRQAPNFNYPIPTSTATETTDIGVLTGYTNANAPARLSTVCADVAKCKVNFWGSTNQPNSRKTSNSIFGDDLKIIGNSVTGYPYLFAQNSFTYAATAIDLVPKAVEYSAGMINYFFRGEMQIRLPAEGVYGIIDGGDPASNCKDACGFKKLKVRLSNVTVPINGVAQDFVGGTITAVVKFSRNTCFQSDFSADPGPLFPFNPSCFVTGSEPVEEQVTADPLPAPFSLASGSEVALTLNFTNPIPVNAWNIKLQFIYRGQMGQELDAVAVHTKRLSSPTPLRYENEYDYLLINQKLYTRAEVNASQTLLSQVVPVSCVTGAAGSRQLVASCFNPQTIPTSWTGTNGVVLASLNALPTNSHAMWVFLIDYFGQTSASFPGPAGTISPATFFARDLISLDADSTQVGGDFLIQWRNLQVWQNFSRYYVASTDQTAAPASVSNQRPAFPTTTPVKMTSVNF